VSILVVLAIGFTLTLLVSLTAHITSALASDPPTGPAARPSPGSAVRSSAGPSTAVPSVPSVPATTDRQPAGEPIDQVDCETQEQAVFHVHAHLAVYVDGQPEPVPAGIGIVPPLEVDPTARFVAGEACLYWLHTHDASGVIHVESPVARDFTLGDLFAIWGRPLGPGLIGSHRGPLHVFVDGRPVAGDPRRITLAAHRVIQIDEGTVVPPRTFTFPTGL
jgi:hypothetical protein